MKKFILISTAMFFVAVAVVVFVWYLIQKPTFDEMQQIPEPVFPDTTSVVESVESIQDTTVISEPAPTNSNTQNITLTAEQRALAESFGLDPDTFVITPEMIMCAEGKVGADRVAAYQVGEKPTFKETLLLASCL